MPIPGLRFLAVGRVFSGTASSGQAVRVLGPEYNAAKGTKEHVWMKTLHRVGFMAGQGMQDVGPVPAGACVRACLCAGTLRWGVCAYAHAVVVCMLLCACVRDLLFAGVRLLLGVYARSVSRLPLSWLRKPFHSWMCGL